MVFGKKSSNPQKKTANSIYFNSDMIPPKILSFNLKIAGNAMRW